MSGFSRNTFTYALATLVLTGGFSRLTHGVYTPKSHAFQIDHLPDDGSLASQITPIVDLMLGFALVSLKTRFTAAVFITVMTIFGTVKQIQDGKKFDLDLLSVAVGAMAILEARSVALHSGTK